MSADRPARPGWFPDPLHANRLRWFDGTEWSDHTIEAPAPPPTAAPGITNPRKPGDPGGSVPGAGASGGPGPLPGLSAPSNVGTPTQPSAPDIPRGNDSAPAAKQPTFLIAAVAAIGVLVVALIGLAVWLESDSTGESEPGAGPPFGTSVQEDLALLASDMGEPIVINGERPRCEILFDILRVLGPGEGTVEREQAVATTSPGGALFITISNATGDSPEAMSAVQACVPYFVGRDF